MMRLVFLICLALPGCEGIAWNTRVAETPAVRITMLSSVQIGKTTESELVTRWGAPVQKVYEGGRTEFIYRDLIDPDSDKLYGIGDSTKYVIVTFQYGKAIAVRSNDTEGCRATFAPKPPGYGFDNPLTVYPVPTCEGLSKPQSGTQVPDDSYASGGKAS